MTVFSLMRKFAITALAVLSLSTAANAAVFSVTDWIAGDGPEGKIYSFQISTPGTYTATLADLGFPAAFDSLSLGIIQSGGVSLLGSKLSPGSFNFTASSTGAYQALVAGTPDSDAEIGFFAVNVDTFPPVPEPAVWFMMLGGVAMLGWMRLRSRERLG